MSSGVLVPAGEAHNALAAVTQMYGTAVLGYEQTVRGLAEKVRTLEGQLAEARKGVAARDERIEELERKLVVEMTMQKGA